MCNKINLLLVMRIKTNKFGTSKEKKLSCNRFNVKKIISYNLVIVLNMKFDIMFDV
jgi:hypothetical protein